jgi:hypothetical protein
MYNTGYKSLFIISGENGSENPSERRLVIASKVNDDVNFYRDVIDLVDTLLYSHQVKKTFHRLSRMIVSNDRA